MFNDLNAYVFITFSVKRSEQNSLRTSHKYDMVCRPKVRAVCRASDRGGRVGCSYDHVTNTYVTKETPNGCSVVRDSTTFGTETFLSTRIITATWLLIVPVA